MKELIDLSTKKLELLKNDGDPRKIIELDVAFNKAYRKFLDKNNLEALDEVDRSKYMASLITLKEVVTEIYAIETKNTKVKRKQKKNLHNKKITNLYKKNMK